MAQVSESVQQFVEQCSAPDAEEAGAINEVTR